MNEKLEHALKPITASGYTCYILMICSEHPDAGKYWAGYDKGCHQYTNKPDEIVQFVREVDAQRAGVSAPNTPYKLHTEFPNKGMVVIPMTVMPND